MSIILIMRIYAVEISVGFDVDLASFLPKIA